MFYVLESKETPSLTLNLPISVKVLFHQICLQKFEWQRHVHCNNEKKKKVVYLDIQNQESSHKSL